MLSSKKYLMPLLAAVLLVTASCAGGILDKGSSADVVLEVLGLENPAVTAQIAGGGGLCTLQVEDWTASMQAAPKNPLAVPPFNDLVLHTVTITYNWIDPAIVTPTRIIGLGDATIPAGGNSSVTFAPIAFDDLTAAMQGHTANLVLVFDATTVEGTHVRSTVQRQLFVEVCAAP